MIPVDLRELVNGFVSESLDNLDDNEINISKLFNDYDSENIESIFRVFHTLKGLSGFFELSVIQKITHSAETLLDLLRTYKIPAGNDTVDLLFVVFDFLQNALKSVAENFTDELLKEESIVLIEQLINKVDEINNNFNINENDKDNIQPEISYFDSIDSKPLTDSNRQDDDLITYYQELIDKVIKYEPVFNSIINQLKNEFSDKLIDDMETIIHQIKASSSLLELKAIYKAISSAESLLKFHSSKRTKLSDSAVIAFEKIKDFMLIVIRYVKKNHNDNEFVAEAEKLSQYIDNEINSLDARILGNEIISSVSLMDCISILEESFKNIEADENDFVSVNLIVENLQILSANDLITSNIEMKDVVHSILSIMQSVASKEINASAVIFIIKSDIKILGKFIRENNILNSNKIEIQTNDYNKNAEISLDNAQDIIDKKNTREAIQQKSDINASSERKEVRVSTDKLNKLFDLVGEIITVETMVVNNKNLAGLKLPDFKASANMLNKLVRELQKITMSIRMIPLEGLFNKMSRLVRDLSRKVNKSAELVIYGADTEMDKNVIEQLSDPLVHMLRNCIDHGIEYESVRLEKGKNPTGRITIGASYQGNEIHITVEDDGAGLDKEKIIQKAISNGQLSGIPTELSDKAICNLIFLPGLSTATVVSDVSGRGVGMDVVKNNIEKLRGGIEIDSKFGYGTKITFRIPLTLAIMDVMIVRVGTIKYAIPILSVRESFQPKSKDITITMDGIEVVKVRNEMYPIIRLHEIMKRTPDNFDLDEGILMMLNTNTKKVCLFVDAILGQQQAVVKPLSEYIGEVQGLTGCMVMADGKIGLILDIEGLIEKAENFIK